MRAGSLDAERSIHAVILAGAATLIPVLTGIDHLVIACPDPDEAVNAIADRLGLAPGGGGRHERLGTFNRLIWLGDSYVELIGVFDRTLAEASWIGAPTIRALDAWPAGTLATWAVASDAIAADVELLQARGSDLGEPVAGERMRPDGRIVRWTLAAPRRLGPTDPPFLIEHDPTAAEWTPAERAERAEHPHPLGGPVLLEALEIPVPDPHRSALRFMAGAGIGPFRPSLAGRGSRDAVVGRQTIRLRPDQRSDALPTIGLRAIGAPADAVRDVELLGCRWVVRAG